jgi:hypothetical protein
MSASVPELAKRQRDESKENAAEEHLIPRTAKREKHWLGPCSACGHATVDRVVGGASGGGDRSLFVRARRQRVVLSGGLEE